MNIRRSALLVLAGAALPLVVAQAQLARPRQPAPDAPKLLVAPLQREQHDSVLSLTVADGMRERLRSAHLDKFNTIPRNIMNENLVQSGFPTDVPLEARVIRDLARFLNARYIIEGTLQRKPGDSMLVIARLTEASGAEPQSVTRSWQLPIAAVRGGTGAEIVNRLVEGYRSFEDVTQCRRALEQNDHARALREAGEALRDYPNSASAYLCIARVQEAQNAPADSVLATLRRAFDADTLNSNTMRRLAARYEASHDTTNLVQMLLRILDVDFRDTDLRISTARLLVGLDRLPDAVTVIEEGLAQNPANLDLLGVKMIALGAQRRWDSAAAVGEIIAGIDSNRVDSAFVLRINNYYRQVPDTANWLKWASTGAQKFPSQKDYVYTVASVSMVRGDSARAMSAAQQLINTAGSEARYLALGHYITAMLLNGRQLRDSALIHADLALAADSTFRPNLAIIYLTVGANARADTLQLERAVELLQKAKDYGANNPRLLEQAAFQLGIAQIQLASRVDQAMQGRDCETSRRIQTLVEASEQNIIAGVAVNRQIANQLLSNQIPQYKTRAEGLIRNNCR